MVQISLETSNCRPGKCFVIEELATASVTLELRFDEIVSTQSRAERKQELVDTIRAELEKFTWLISGSVQIEFAWYLHGIERQETDKVVDIDNITKPILDALSGPKGLLIDDSQIGSIHTFWMSRNEQLTDSVLRLEVKFSNDDCLDKKNLFFIKYWNAMCVAINIDFDSPLSTYGACVVVQARKRHRRFARTLNALGASMDQFLVGSTWDFHRTRVGNFPVGAVLTVPQFMGRVIAAGLTRRNAPRVTKRSPTAVRAVREN